MKKVLSIILLLVLIMGTVVVPGVSVSAEGVTDANFTDGVTWRVSKATDTTMEGELWGAVKGADGSVVFSDDTGALKSRSVFAKITGFEVGATYNLSFSIPTSGIEHVTIVLDDTANFKNHILYGANGQTRINSNNCSTFTNGVAAKTFTTTNNFIYLAVKFDSTVTAATFNNFNIEEKMIAASDFTDGVTWKVSDGTTMDGASWGSATGSNGSITISNDGIKSRSVFTKVTGFVPGRAYSLNLTTTSGVENVTVAVDDSAYFKNQILYADTNKFKRFIASGTNYSIKFIAENTFVYLAIKLNSSTSSITVNNFAVKTFNAAETAGYALTTTTWGASQGSATINHRAGNVAMSGINYQCAYVPVTLAPYTKYTFSFTHTAAALEHFLVVPSNNSNATNGAYPVEFHATLLSSTDTTKSYQFTTGAETDYHFKLKVGNTASYTISDLVLAKGATLTEEQIVGNALANDGTWTVTANAGGTVTQSKGTVKITGAQYQQISVPLTGLKANTTYTISFNHNANGDKWYHFANTVYIIPNETEYNANILSKEGTIKYTYEDCNTDTSTTIRFTTDNANSTYLLVLDNRDLTGMTIILSDFAFAAKTAYGFKGTAIRAASADVPQGMRFKNTISKDLLANGYNGKEIVEYGTLAAFEKNITTDFTYENVDGKNIKKGVAFDVATNTNVVFEEDDANITYTAVLIGIEKEKYNLNCKVRSYMVLSDGSVIYGDIQTYSVYSMFKAILNGNNADDKAVVNAIFEDAEILAGYEAWISENAN